MVRRKRYSSKQYQQDFVDLVNKFVETLNKIMPATVEFFKVSPKERFLEAFIGLNSNMSPYYRAHIYTFPQWLARTVDKMVRVMVDAWFSATGHPNYCHFDTYRTNNYITISDALHITERAKICIKVPPDWKDINEGAEVVTYIVVNGEHTNERIQHIPVWDVFEVVYNWLKLADEFSKEG
jgi:hypothetical protein